MGDVNNINPAVPYRTAVAERGKFWKVDDEYLEGIGYPLSGEGKYSVLTYQVNPSPVSIEGDINLGQVELKDGDSSATLDIVSVGTTNVVPSIILDLSGDQIEDMAGLYQNTIISNQIALTGGPQQLTPTTDRGYLKIRISSGGSVYIGDVNVTNLTGYLLDDDYPVETLTFEDLSTVYANGTGTLYVIGGAVT